MSAGPTGYDPAESGEMDDDDANPGYGGTGGPRLGRDVLFQAILKALAANDTPLAWQTIERLLKGEIQTGLDDRRVVDEVLQILLANYRGPEHATGRLLQLALATPEQLRPAAGSQQMLAAADLRQRVLDLHMTSAASAIDALLGVPAVQPAARRGSPVGYGEDMEDMEEEVQESAAPDSDRVQAQTAPAADPLQIQVRQVSPEEARRMLEYLGRPELLETIESQLRSLSSLTDASAGRQLALAGSLPVAALRTAQYELLQAHWNDGAAGLIGQKLFEQGPRDPGLLVVLKSVPLLHTLPLRQPSTPRAQQENESKHSWANAVRQLVRTLNARFYAASQNRSSSGAGAGTAQAAGGSAAPPVRLHQGAKVAAEYRLAWPDDTGVEVPAAFSDRFVVHYLRLEPGAVNAEQLLRHYEKQIRGGKAAFALNNFEAWIEHEGAAAGDPNRRVSTDVMLTVGRGGGGGGGGSDSAAYGGGGERGERTQNIVIEILSIEIPNPRPAAKDVAQKIR